MFAHWLTPTNIVIANNDVIDDLVLITQHKNNAAVTELSALKKTPLPAALATQFPHLSSFDSYTLLDEVVDIKSLLKQPLWIAKANNKQILSQIQFAPLIDYLYTSGPSDANEFATLGAVVNKDNISIALWSPTASAVHLQLFDANKKLIATEAMQEDNQTGVWQKNLASDYIYHYYRYQIYQYYPQVDDYLTVTITDPYSLSLSTNSRYSQIVDLSSPNVKPAGWSTQLDPTLDRPEQHIIYETHVGDFSAVEKQLTDEKNRGKFLAYTDEQSFAGKHLAKLRAAGLNTIHLLPIFDIGTIEEEPGKALNLQSTLSQVCDYVSLELCRSNLDLSQNLQQYFATFDETSVEVQAVMESIRGFDNYNWGYDPFHFNVPEGSYSTNPEGITRIIEFRQLVQSLHNRGFRVIMDVVYNHTHAAGLNSTSVLDKIVPNYYQRLNPMTGAIEQSTCCDNTATERAMMAKLMIDSLVIWAKEYRIDGFRFDLMGHQPKALMLQARNAVQAIDPDNYFYGEGWNFGEVANNQRFIQASQKELAGTEIGTFTDRLRDAVRGGESFVSGDDYRIAQGIGNGLLVANNELLSDKAAQKKYQLLMDQLRIGLTGNLQSYALQLRSGEIKSGKDIPYGDQPTGYAIDPADTINYVSKHDNQTLWDNNQYRNHFSLSTDDRVRMHLQSLSYALYAQGIPFIHMGSELLRSKSFLRDSYDYGDWFNAVDFSKQSNNYAVGLPPAVKDEANWPLIKKLLEKNQGRDKVKPRHIQLSAAIFNDMLSIKTSSGLLSLASSAQINRRVTFNNTGETHQEGVIVMTITDDDKTSVIDPRFQKLVLVFNNAVTPKTITYKDATKLVLHPVQQNGNDELVKSSTISEGTLTVPKLTTAVFVQYRQSN